MRYIFLTLIVAILSGCGGSSSDEEPQRSEVPSPTPQDITKQPPSVPSLD